MYESHWQSQFWKVDGARTATSGSSGLALTTPHRRTAANISFMVSLSLLSTLKRECRQKDALARFKYFLAGDGGSQLGFDLVFLYLSCVCVSFHSIRLPLFLFLELWVFFSRLARDETSCRRIKNNIGDDLIICRHLL